MSKQGASVGEPTLPFEGGLPGSGLHIDWDKRVTFGRLLNEVSASRASIEAMGSIGVDDLAIIDPVEIHGALLVGHQREADVDNAYRGLVLPPEDYGVIVISPSMLAMRARARTEKARASFDDTGTVEAAKDRAAGHILEKALLPMQARRDAISKDVDNLVPVVREAKVHWRAHFRAENLYTKTIEAKGSIEAMVKVAGNRLGWSVDEHKMAQRALTVQLLALRGNGNQRAANWVQYGSDAIHYGKRRSLVIRGSQNAVERELKQYQPALDRKRG